MSAARIDELRERLHALQEQAEQTEVSLNDLNTAWRRYLALARRVGLPEPIMDAMTRLQQLNIAMRTLYTSALMLQTVSGPVGWATAIAGVALGTVMLADQMAMERTPY